MKMLKFILAPLALCAASLGAQAQDGSVVTEDNQVGDWLVRCVTQGEAPRECAMITRAVNVEQQDLAIIRFIRVSEEQRRGDEQLAAQLTVPTNVNVRAGIEIVVDQNVITTVDYEVCTPRNCITTFAVTDEMIATMGNGFGAALVLTDATGLRVQAIFSLDGFLRATELL